MTWDDFDTWAPRSVRDLAAGQVAAGLQDPAEADAFAERTLLGLLPDGLATPLHHLWSVRWGPADETVGHLWVRVRPVGDEAGDEAGDEVEAYVLDVVLDPAARGRGLGRATMLAAEGAARDLGATVAGLTVLAHNTVARRLYDSLGYRVASLTATKRLAAPRSATATTPRLRLRVATVAEAGRSPSTGHQEWTAYDADDAVGVLRIHLQRRSDGPHACIERLEVREDRRGRGLGWALADAAERELLDLGVRTVRVCVPGSDVVARSLSAHRGFALAALELSKPLGRPV